MEGRKKASARTGKCSQLWVVKVRGKGKDKDEAGSRTRRVFDAGNCIILGKAPSPAQKASPLAPFPSQHQRLRSCDQLPLGGW